MSRTHSPVVQVVAIGIGAALFFVLGRFVAIPTPIPNTTISIQYAILAVLAVLYGPWVGLLTGFIGHVLIDVTGFGIWLSWEVASGVFGLVVALVLLRHRIHDGEFSGATALRFVLAVAVGHATAWLLIAPLGDVLIYNEPAAKVWTQGTAAFTANTITTAVLGTLILAVYARTRTKTGSLTVQS